MLSVPFLKHAVVTDATVDIFIDEEVEWAMSNRFRADRDLVLIGGQRPFPMEVAVGANETVTKIGYDLTGPLAVDGIRAEVAAAPRIVPLQRHATVRDALADGPQYFGDLMANLGSRDGREIVVALESLGTFGGLSRTLEGKWALKK
jgi:3-polyprenyl-4-hydroxybenzoate decarboxylase